MIAVLGASGAVGRHVVAALIEAGVGPLRLGARRPTAIMVGKTAPGTQLMAVDVTDPTALAEFCAGADLVVNCAGPGYRLAETAAKAALHAGADYVDALGDEVAIAPAEARAADRTVVLSAGTVPGLSVLVPRLLAESAVAAQSKATRLVAYAGGLEMVTTTVAADILSSLNVGGSHGEPFGYPLAAWRHGRREARVLRSDENAEVPFYPTRVAVQPLLTAEIERLAASLGLTEADWYNVYPGQQVRALFTTLPTLPTSTSQQRSEIVSRIIRAAAIDLAGVEPYYRMVFTLSGPDWSRTAVVRTEDSYRLTAEVLVIAARAVLDGRIETGIHLAGDVLRRGRSSPRSSDAEPPDTP